MSQDLSLQQFANEKKWSKSFNFFYSVTPQKPNFQKLNYVTWCNSLRDLQVILRHHNFAPLQDAGREAVNVI